MISMSLLFSLLMVGCSKLVVLDTVLLTHMSRVGIIKLSNLVPTLVQIVEKLQ